VFVVPHAREIQTDTTFGLMPAGAGALPSGDDHAITPSVLSLETNDPAIRGVEAECNFVGARDRPRANRVLFWPK
jgi:hypothetical protein